MDLNMVSSLVGLKTNDFTVGQISLEVVSSKLKKYEKTCSYIQHTFIPFAFDTFGFIAPDTNHLRRFQILSYSAYKLE